MQLGIFRGTAWNSIIFYIKRYYIAEIISFFTSYLAYIIASSAFRNDLISAYCGTSGAFVGFYLPIAFSEWRSIAPDRNEKLMKKLIQVIKNLSIEFGISEILDFFIFRPFCLYSASSLIPSETVAIVAGNQAANITFFGIAALMHKFGRKPQSLDRTP